MKKNIIPDSTKVLSTYHNKYASLPSSGFSVQQMPPMGMQPIQQPRTPSPIMDSPVMRPNYIQGYLQQFIGHYVRIDFLVGTGTFIDRDGVLTRVGVDFVELREVQTGNVIVGDLYSIKFITVYTNNLEQPAL